MIFQTQCHSRESGSPDTLEILDSRFRGNDVRLPMWRSKFSSVAGDEPTRENGRNQKISEK